MPKLNYKCLDNTYRCLCIIATIVLVAWSFYLYHLNDDVSRVDYKIFHAGEDDIYPSISLCFGNVFVEEKLKDGGVSKDLYIKFLKGEVFSDSMLRINYTNVTINPADFLLGIAVEQDLDSGDVNPNHDYWFDNTNEDDEDSWKPHWESHMVDHFGHFHGRLYKCLTVDVPYIPNEHINWIAVVMKKSIFPDGVRPAHPYGDTLFSVQMSYPGQRLRYAFEKHNWNVISMNQSYGTKFIINGLEVLKRRNKRKEPCHEDWKQDDIMVRENMIKKVKCTPPYWKEDDLSKEPDCTKIEEMKQFYEMAWKKFTRPCQQISMVSYLDVDSPTTYYTSRINGTLSNLNDYFYVALDFPKTMFKEIQLIRALDEQSLFGNIGGYVGACLGYSFLQIPGFIHLMYQKLCTKST